ncbi:response regulator [Legionella micdadei]|uniref:Transcriptional regulatory protein RstA n=1 Tax=Legionella micdadei TaxID=451 RepID=A0A098GC06_LEGMI|nr:response regulator [Legionella micdadei]ARG98298.1 DNA-binding response regulator [Legionella micdadei]ARH01050.1 DNA-binding response regulator [Legionella micdadei]KTD27228.1 DNA-binding response regulator in two-component regulatory system with EnvZ [Legionella micdadei]NSL18616.1 response regulator [Legionella micdadei]CEG60033.1 Transcriptional regulatory protein RstA [Legionella micdadei]
MKNKSILLVEDNLKLANYLKESLLDAGYEVSIEKRGDRAVYRILREQPEIVILDIMLPGMNGDQICHTIRDDYSGKILMLTAVNDIESEVSSLNLGADDYLTKPVAEEVLKARIEALLRRPNLVNNQNQFQFGNFSINLSNKSVRLFDEEISISTSDFEVLALLVKNHDKLLSRNSIMYALYGREYDGVERSIDLKISRLRKALNDDGKKPYRIKTIHKKGYVFVSDSWK